MSPFHIGRLILTRQELATAKLIFMIKTTECSTIYMVLYYAAVFLLRRFTAVAR